jgi:hypothetical protein
MKLKNQERRRVNGFLIYEDGERCDGCGAVQKLDLKYPDDPAGFILECPECYRPGCEECMPAGRGCKCPDCEATE